MPRSKEISEEVRKLIVDTYDSGKGYKTISKALGVHLSTVKSIVFKWRTCGTIVTLPRSGRPIKMFPKVPRKKIREGTMGPNAQSIERQAPPPFAKSTVVAKCMVNYCENNTRRIPKNQQIMLHGFPKTICGIITWLRQMHQDFGDLEEFANHINEKHIYYRVCSEHFTLDSYYIHGEWRRLKPGAIPTIFQTKRQYTDMPTVPTVQQFANQSSGIQIGNIEVRNVQTLCPPPEEPFIFPPTGNAFISPSSEETIPPTNETSVPLSEKTSIPRPCKESPMPTPFIGSKEEHVYDANQNCSAVPSQNENTEKKKTTEIFSHILDIIYLLTGEVSLLQHLNISVMMNKMNLDLKQMNRKILKHSLEIIYLITGEEYTIVKNTPRSSIQQQTGERECKEEPKEFYKEVMMENRQTLKSIGNSENKISGLHKENPDAVLINSKGEYEREEKPIPQLDVHPNLCAGLCIENLYKIKIEEEAAEEKEDHNIQQVEIHPDLGAGLHDENLHTIEINQEAEDRKPEPEIHSSQCKDGLMSRNTPGHHHNTTDFGIGDIGVTKGYPISNTPFKMENKYLTNVAEELNSGVEEHLTKPHLSTFTDNKNEECLRKTSDVTNASTAGRPSVCSECGKSFRQKAHLINHQRTHTGEKPFACPDCGRCFSQQSSLIKHQRVHTGEKPFVCSECGICFIQQSSLIKHQRVHTGEKPFVCFQCGKCFSQQSNLIKHKRVHKDDNP